MKMKVHFFVICCIGLIVSCEESVNTIEGIGIAEAVNYDVVQKITFEPELRKDQKGQSIETLLDTMFMVKLSNETLIAQITKMRVHEQRIFIFDSRAQSISIFDLQGNLIGIVNRKGKGPGEYVKIADFTLDLESESILILDQFNRKIISYSFKGEFEKEQKYRTHARYFNMLGPDHYVIFNDFNDRWKGVNYNLFVTDTEGEVNAHAFPYSDLHARTNRAKDNYLTYHDSSTANYIGHYDNHVYRVTKDSVWAQYYLDFGRVNLPKDIVHDSFEALDGYVNNIGNYFETTDFITFSHIYNKVLNVRYYDKVANAVIPWKLTVPNLLYFYSNFPVKTVYEDYFVSFADAEYYPELFGYENLIPKDTKYSVMLDELRGVEEEDNPILFFFKLRSPSRDIENETLTASLND